MKQKSISHKLLAAIVSIGTFLATTPAAADVWRPEALPEASGQASLTLDDGWRFFGATSSITQLDSTHTVWGEACEGWFGVCEISDRLNAVANLILPVCESANQTNCLESFSIGQTSSSMIQAKPARSIAGYNIGANPASGLPKGSLPTVFEAELPNASGSKAYVVNARVLAGIRNGKVDIGDFQVSVWPISDRVSPGKVPVHFKPADAQRKASVEGMWDVQCAVVDQDYCGQIEDFSPGSKVQVVVRIPNQITGWLKGRLTGPEISSTPFGQSSNRFVIGGEPVTVPKLGAKLSNLDSDFIRADGRTTVGVGPNTYNTLRADSPTGIKFVKKLVDATNDTAAATESLWYVGSIPNSPELARCTPKAGQFVGLVTTNAMAFDGGVPKYQSGFFSYNLAGLHYAPDGKTEITGTYDLAIRSDVARCLYGFSRAPISATLTVTGSSGEEKVATSIVNERAGWLTLSAKDFTFSQNQIKVRVTQPKKFTVAKFGGSSKVLTASQKRSITAATPSKGTEVTCVGLYRANKNQKLAAERARASCDQVAKKLRGIKRTIETKKVSSSSLDGRVRVAVQ
jgi:hypothetical protein